MIKLVKVNTLAVAERWQKQMREERHPMARFRIGIWELNTENSGDYSYSSNSRYVVGNQTSIKIRVSNVGKRIDK
tara:strand:+ start:105 stop:329 length:225 start_codon:yes stop_codon:yes gene_type:complete